MTQEQLTKYSRGEWAGAVCNHFWWSPVYLFSLTIKLFQWLFPKYRKRGWWRCNHCIRIVNGVVIEMLAAGKVETPLEVWVTRQRRSVAMFKPLVWFQPVPATPYDFFGIPQVVLHYARLCLGLGNNWNGKDGVPKGLEGYFCSEELAAALGHPYSHLVLPCQAFEMEDLWYMETVETFKQQNYATEPA